MCDGAESRTRGVCVTEQKAVAVAAALAEVCLQCAGRNLNVIVKPREQSCELEESDCSGVTEWRDAEI